MAEVEFTEEELSQLEGRDVEPDGDVVQPGTEEEPVSESAEEPVEEKPEVEAPVAEDATDYKNEYEKMQKANAGLLNELVSTRRNWKQDKEWRQGVEGRMELLTSKISEPEEAAKEDLEPDQDNDPVDWLAWKQRQEIGKALEPLNEQAQEAERQREYEAVVQEAGRVAVRAEEEFIANSKVEREEYQTALDELRFDRLKWYTATGVQPQDALAIVEQEEREFVINALNSNMNPAAEIMRMHSQVQPGKIPGKEEAPKQEVAAPKEEVLNKISAAKQGVAESGLQNVGGSGNSGSTITAAQFSEMDMDDPVFKKIAGNEALFARLNIYGEVSL